MMAPIAVADVFEGAAFGAVAVAVLGQTASVTMSLTAFSGSAQWAAVSVAGSDGTIGAALLAAAALNVRYLAMSATVARTIGGSRLRRAATCLLLTDAAWAVVSGGAKETAGARLSGAGATELFAWTGGTLIGVLAGHAVGSPESFGLDAAFPALFLWLLRDQLSGRGAIGAALGGAVLALLLSPLLPQGLPILAVGLAAALVGTLR